jgi:hypothetical protein
VLGQATFTRHMKVEPRPDLVVANNGKLTLRIDGVFIHSTYNPEKEAQKWAQGLFAERPLPKDALWVIFGVGLGYHIQALLDIGVSEILAFEPEKLVATLWQKENIALPTGANVEITDSISNLRDSFRMRYPSASSVQMMAVPAYARLYPQQLTDIHDRLDAYVQEYKTGYLTYIFRSKSWALATLENIPTMLTCPSVQQLRGLTRGMPTVIVSPGPSLDKTIQDLSRYRDRFLVIAPSQSLKALATADVRPDLVLVTDSARLDYHFQGCPRDFFRHLVLCTDCHPAVVELPAERKFFYYLPPNPLAKKMYALRGEEAAELPPGHSVANVAFNLALAMGADPIILMGQDLAFRGTQMYCRQGIDGGQEVEFSPDGQSLSMRRFETKLKLAPEGQLELYRVRLEQPQQVVWVQGQNGERLASKPDMRAMLTWFERQAEALAGKLRLINTSEGGAYIRGMEHRRFCDVAAELCERPPIDFAALIQALPQMYTTESERVLNGLRELHHGLQEVTRRAAACLEIASSCRRALMAGDCVALPELEQQEAILKTLLAEHPEINSVIQEALLATRIQDETRADDLSSNLELSESLYQITHNGSSALQQALEQSIKKGAEI